MEKRVLILDDDPDILNFLKHELKKSRFACDTAQTGEDAIGLLESYNYFAAIFDIVLGPNATSNEVIQFIAGSKDKSISCLPIIITSAYMTDDYASKIEKKSLNVYKAVAKPFKAGLMTSYLNQLDDDINLGRFFVFREELEENDFDDSELVAEQNSLRDMDTSLVAGNILEKQKKINEALLSHDDPKYRNSEGETALMIFAARGEIERARKLLARGADSNARSKAGKTPLHYAVISGNLDLLKLLIENGAKIGAKDEMQVDPLWDAIEKRKYHVVDFLINQGARVDNRVQGKTYLIRAMELDDTAIFNRLLAAGIDPKIKDHAGRDIKQLARLTNKNHFMRIINTLRL